MCAQIVEEVGIAFQLIEKSNVLFVVFCVPQSGIVHLD